MPQLNANIYLLPQRATAEALRGTLRKIDAKQGGVMRLDPVVM